MNFVPQTVVITLNNITQKLRETFSNFVDTRKGKNKQYTMIDAALSAFSIFFMQSPSFLEYQRTLEQTHGRNNARSLFGVHEIPCDNQIRTLLDSTPPSALEPMFDYLFDSLNQAGIINKYRSKLGYLLIALDGTETFSSKKIHCKHCSTRNHANGETTYYHSAITPVLVKPKCDKVIPLLPEFIQPQDGAEKQDCEINAAKRLLASHGKKFAKMKVIYIGDDLYCHEPFCREVSASEFEFIFTCKSSSHSTTQEWLDYLQYNDCISTIIRRRWTGKRHEIDTYRYVNQVPLRDAKDALNVNWCEITTTDKNDKVLYKNSFATSLPIDDKNVIDIIEAGRSRWKIENENNNVLKNNGYHFEHNYGHGKNFLSNILATLNILAFLVHTVLDWMDDKYRLLREKLPSRRRFFEDIRVLTSYLCFDSWDALMDFMLDSFEDGASYLESG